MRSNDVTEANRYSVSYEKGDLVLIRAPVTKKGQTSRLLYQAMGPFEVIGPASSPDDDGAYNAYKLRHLTSNNVTSYNVMNMHPYISRTAHTKIVEQKRSDNEQTGVVEKQNFSFEPQPGDFLLFPNFNSVAYHLVQVAEVANGDVSFHYYNTSDKKRLRRFRKVWTSPVEAKEIQSMTKPAQKGWTQDLHSADVGEFCQMQIPTTLGGTSGAGRHLTVADVKRVLAYVPPNASE